MTSESRHKYSRLVLTSKIYSTAQPAWWSAANHGIGVVGHWGRIERGLEVDVRVE